MKPRVGWVVVVLGALLVGWLWLRRGTTARTSTASSPALVDPRARVTTPAHVATPPPAHVSRLASAADRQRVADQIAAARTARLQQPPPARPSIAPAAAPSDVERAPEKLQAALREAIPFLAECYQTGSGHEPRPAVQLTLIGDPAVGTLVDADQLVGPDGAPLDAELESCLRTTLASLELPPLGSSEPLHIQYSFRFDN